MDETTQTDTSPGAAAQATSEALVLSVVSHPDPSQVGAFNVLNRATTTTIGRHAGCFGPGVLDVRRLSRQHFRLRVAPDEGVSLKDLGSRNGTQLNGEAVEETSIQVGDVIGAGGILMLLHRGQPLTRRSTHPELIGVSAANTQVLLQIAEVAQRDTVTLVHGETGTGKELVARALHQQSGRDGALVAVNCGAVTDSMVASELFGHRRGAFSGAVRDRTGLVRAAEGGTLFLDEVGDASPKLQVSLLRLVEARTYRAVGSEVERTADVRFVAATHRPLEDHVRADLAARLRQWVIEVPPLRERREDIPHLAVHFARRAAGSEVVIDREFMLALLRYDWPANVRELKGVVERAVVAAGGDPFIAATPVVLALLKQAPAHHPPAQPPSVEASPPAKRRRVRPTPEELREVLQRWRGNLAAAAEELQVTRNTVYRWVDAAGIDLDSLRGPR